MVVVLWVGAVAQSEHAGAAPSPMPLPTPHVVHHTTVLPAQGNRDDFGRISRMLDGWGDALLETDQLRSEVERERRKAERAEDRRANDIQQAVNAVRQELEADVQRLEDECNILAEQLSDANEQVIQAEALRLPPPAEAPVPAQTPPPTLEPARPSLSRITSDLVRELPDPVRDGPISSVSQQLAHFSEYVTAAAGDVEKTEGLIKGLEGLGVLVDEITGLVTDIRDQANVLAFRSPSRDAQHQNNDADNLVAFSPDGRATDAERAYAQRFDALRNATEQTERTVSRIQMALSDVTIIARAIAETASHQALDATHKLLDQSEYLQNMLDDILHKIQPAKLGGMSERRDKDEAG